VTPSKPPEHLDTAHLCSGSTTFRVSRLAFGDSRIRVRTTALGWVVVALLVLVGAGIALWIVRDFIQGGTPALDHQIAAGFVAVMGLVLAYVVLPNRGVTFDLQAGVARSKRRRIPMRDIVGIQVLEYDNDGFTYELNLVFTPSLERVNVLEHSAEEHIVADAARLAEVLSVPMWRMRSR
jgi:hypothetical protein